MENAIRSLLARADPPKADGNDPVSQLLELLRNPFSSQLQQTSIFAALGSSIGITAGIALAFSFLRPYNSVVYAPKLKHADEKHAPPPLGKGVFAWVVPLWATTEQDLVNLVGLDAAIFMRFTRMCRNLFVTLSVIGCSVLIPVNINNTIDTPDKTPWISRITPLNVWADAQWATVVVAWLFTLIICGYLWWNYRKVTQLRRQYFLSEEYQTSLHARTLMLYDIPKNCASDEGIARIIDGVAPNSSFSRTAIARDVKVLPDLIKEHGKTVRKLEKVLAIYLKDPANLPPTRPLCTLSKKDPEYSSHPSGHKVDAIEYLTQRIRVLEFEIKDVRQRVDKRGSMPYGFASYADIAEAHAIAYACRKKKPQGATVKLAPRPNDVIWENMPLSSSIRRTKSIWNNFWVAVLTLLWIAPNAGIAIFLVNLANLGLLWPAFQRELEANRGFWSLVQGIASPAITSLIYLLLPILFRRMSIRAGDQTKTGRERHVVAKLYAFFVFNNLFVFSVFSGIWSFVTGVVKKTESGVNPWEAIVQQDFGFAIFASLCNISTFWVTWLLQRQLGAAIDLAQLWTLFYSFIMRKLSSPTPRELIELTAPPPFDYASYYNYFLFYSTVTLCYAGLQPLVLPAAALYFCIDVALKKYLLLYIFVTKTESGGVFWRVLFNRFLFGTILSQLVMFLIVWVRGDGTRHMVFAVAPLPFIMIAFKIFCARAFDDKILFFATRASPSNSAESGLNVKEQSLRNDRLAARFGHPALYKPLITPMVHAKAQNILASIYQGRLSDGRDAGSGDTMSMSGYSDTYVLDTMSSGKAGKVSSSVPGFEVVPESRLDFQYYKNRDEFAEDHGGGEIFGTHADVVRPGTPGNGWNGPGSPSSRPATPVGGMGFAGGGKGPTPFGSGPGAGYSTYNPPHQQPSGYPAPQIPSLSTLDIPRRTRSPMYSVSNDSGTNLVQDAAGMAQTTPTYPLTPATPGSRDRSFDSGPSRGPGGFGPGNPRAPGMLGGGPYGYGGLPQADEDGVQSPPLVGQPAEQQPYDYFRGNRRRDGGGAPGAATRGGDSGWGGN